VWLGTSVETQEYTWRLDALQEAVDVIKPKLIWCSAEPLLGPLDLRAPLSGGLKWVVVGGESGSDRPLALQWVRDLIEQCRFAEVACFVKQLGATPEEQTATRRIPLHLHHAKGGDWDEWPGELQMRQFP
jgi:protein gp37